MVDARDNLAPWWELRFTLPRGNADDVAALLVDGGALGVQTVTGQQARHDAWSAHPSMGPSCNGAALGVDSLHELGEEASEVELLASFTGVCSAEDVLAASLGVLEGFGLAERLHGVAPVRREDTGWAHAWRRHFKPMKVGRRLWIMPSWETHFVPPAGSVVLPLDPGMAFGTGQHATTALCLRAIEDRADRKEGLGRVLDVGCGSGILALGALALGAQHATLMDVDAAAVQASEENLRRAGFVGRFRVDAALPPVTEGGFDLVVANILAPTLCDLSEQLVAQLGPRGQLLLSGILEEQASSVIAAIQHAAAGQKRRPLQLERLQHLPWVALQMTAQDKNAA